MNQGKQEQGLEIPGDKDRPGREPGNMIHVRRLRGAEESILLAINHQTQHRTLVLDLRLRGQLSKPLLDCIDATFYIFRLNAIHTDNEQTLTAVQLPKPEDRATQ